MKMRKEILTFGNIEIEKDTFYCHKSLIFLKDADIEKVLVLSKISSGEKNCTYLIGYLYGDYKVKPLHIMLPETSAYVKINDGLQMILIEDDDLLENYNII